MRVLFISSELSVKNSAESFVSYELLNGFLQNDCIVDVILEGDSFVETSGRVIPVETEKNIYFYKVLNKLFGIQNKGFVKKAIKIIDTLMIENYDIIFIRSEPIINHLIAIYINEKFNKKCVCSFSDLGSVSPFLKKNSIKNYIYKKITSRIENKVINFDNIITQTNSYAIEEYKRKGFKTKNFFVLPNPIRIVKKNINEKDFEALCVKYKLELGSKINIFYIGTFYTFRKIDPLLKFFSIYDNIQITVFGGLKNIYYSDNLLFKYLRFIPLLEFKIKSKIYGVKNLKIAPYIPLEDLEIIIREKADILVNIDADFEPNPFLSSKIVQYILYDKPIVNFTNKGATTDFLASRNILFYVPYKNFENKLSIEELKKICKPKNNSFNDYIAKDIVYKFINDIKIGCKF